MSEIRLLRQHIVKLQEEITKVKKSPTYVMSFVTNDTIPQQLQRNTVYYNLSNDEILVWNDFTNEWFMLSGGGSGGLSFEELSSMIIAGEGITLSVDSEQQTITINSVGLSSVDWDDINEKPTAFPPSAHEHSDTEVELTETYTGNLAGATTQKDANDILDALVSGGSGIFIRRSFFAPPYTSYRGFAPENSLETDAVWTITKTVENADGTIFSNEQVLNHKWTEINTI